MRQGTSKPSYLHTPWQITEGQPTKLYTTMHVQSFELMLQEVLIEAHHINLTDNVSFKIEYLYA